MKKLKKLVNKKTLLIATPVMALSVTGGVWAYTSNNPEPEKQQTVTRAESIDEVDQTEPVDIAPTETTPAQQQKPSESTGQTQPAVATNPFDQGWASWYAYNRRAEIGKPLTATTNNARTFCTEQAIANQPSLHAVGCTQRGGNAHFMFVEQVNGDGTVWATEMNGSGQVSMTDATPTGGFNRVSWRLYSADHLKIFKFIP